ncbi:unnamed protein product [Haemonchus placei]|uniref:Uncharacterized protein n=1 Tax=Haemonchus placei TaxID=6290 RepID=A0A0N4VTM2_HAEPC|nr:unnamed protein product [Haemonchus placei]
MNYSPHVALVYNRAMLDVVQEAVTVRRPVVVSAAVQLWAVIPPVVLASSRAMLDVDREAVTVKRPVVVSAGVQPWAVFPHVALAYSRAMLDVDQEVVTVRKLVEVSAVVQLSLLPSRWYPLRFHLEDAEVNVSKNVVPHAAHRPYAWALVNHHAEHDAKYHAPHPVLAVAAPAVTAHAEEECAAAYRSHESMTVMSAHVSQLLVYCRSTLKLKVRQGGEVTELTLITISVDDEMKAVGEYSDPAEGLVIKTLELFLQNFF